MKSRIVKIYESFGLNAARFADEIGVQRSSISHIVSGRNNPSLEIILKILGKFPDLNPDWLLFNTGEMKRANTKEGSVTKGGTGTPVAMGSLFDQQTSSGNPKKVERDDAQPLDETTKNTTKDVEKEQIMPPVELFHIPGRKVEKILVFYTDRTFREYTPEA